MTEGFLSIFLRNGKSQPELHKVSFVFFLFFRKKGGGGMGISGSFWVIILRYAGEGFWHCFLI